MVTFWNRHAVQNFCSTRNLNRIFFLRGGGVQMWLHKYMNTRAVMYVAWLWTFFLWQNHIKKRLFSVLYIAIDFCHFHILLSVIPHERICCSFSSKQKTYVQNSSRDVRCLLFLVYLCFVLRMLIKYLNPGNINKMVTPAGPEAALKITIQRKQMVNKWRAQSCSWWSPGVGFIL